MTNNIGRSVVRPACGQPMFFRRRAASVALMMVVLLGTVQASLAADRVVLRSFEPVDGNVRSFDEDGVQLDTGRLITWDNIERASLDEERQEAFDRLLADVGEPMFRIRRGLIVGDYRGILEHTRSMYSRYSVRRSPAAYFVCQAHMWALQAHGRREEALAAYVRCLDLLREAGSKPLDLPGERRIRHNPSIGLAAAITPVWFDRQAAQQQLPIVRSTIRGMRSGRPDGVYIYFATLALAAGDRASAERVLAASSSKHAQIQGLRHIVNAQLALDEENTQYALQHLDKIPSAVADALEPLSLYWRGTAQLAAATSDLQKQHAQLTLLQIPARFSDTRPALAAAGLGTAIGAAQSMSDRGTAAILRAELIGNFPLTYHAQQFARQNNTKSAD